MVCSRCDTSAAAKRAPAAAARQSGTLCRRRRPPVGSLFFFQVAGSPGSIASWATAVCHINGSVCVPQPALAAPLGCLPAAAARRRPPAHKSTAAIEALFEQRFNMLA